MVVDANFVVLVYRMMFFRRPCRFVVRRCRSLGMVVGKGVVVVSV